MNHLYDKKGAVEKVNRWSVFEISFNAGSECEDIFSGVELEVLFKGPGNIEKRVKGFWYAGNIYKVRFTPTMEGIWTYSSCSCDPQMNNLTGTLECIPALEGVHGFLRRDEEYRYHFIFDDRTRYFMFGQTYYFILGREDPIWKESIDGTLSKGMNKVRFNCIAYSVEEERFTYYFDKMDRFIEYMYSKGMIADLIVFGFGLGTVKWEDEICEKYARYMIARYAAYPNAIWDLVNEWNYTPKPKSFWRKIGSLFKNEDPWNMEGNHTRLLSIHQQTRVDFQFFDQDWVSHVIFQYGVRNGQQVQADEWVENEINKTQYVNGDEWGNYGILHNWGRNIPVVNDEFGYLGEFNDRSAGGIPLTREKHRNILWGIYTAGGYGTGGDKYEYGELSRPYFTGYWQDPAEYGDIQQLIRFFTTKGIEYHKMSSHNELVRSGIRTCVLAEIGRQYVVYAAAGGEFAVEIALGSYTAWLFNPVTGEETYIKDIISSGTYSFTTPAGSDWVVRIAQK